MARVNWKDNLDLAEENTILGEEFAETNEAEELAEANPYPALEGLWTVSPFDVEFTSYAEGDTTYILFSAEDLTPIYATADEDLGREEGWHLGIKFNEPEGMTDEARAAVKYSFDNNPASGLYSEEPTYSNKYLELWVRLTKESVEDILKNDDGIKTVTFNIFNDGEHKTQTFIVSIDVSNINLVQDGAVKLQTKDGEVIIEDGKGLLSVEFYVNCSKLTGDAYTADAYKNVIKGQKVARPASDPTSPNKGFDGWYKDEDCTRPFDFDSDTIEANTILYGQFLDFVTVTFKNADSVADSAKIAGPFQVMVGKMIDPANIPAPNADGVAKEGYTVETEKVGSGSSAEEIVVWYTDPEGGDVVDLLRDELGDESLVVYPHYIPEETTIKFWTGDDADKVSDITGVKYGDNVDAPAEPTKAGAEFLGWKVQDIVVPKYNSETGEQNGTEKIFDSTKGYAGYNINAKNYFTFDKELHLRGWKGAYTEAPEDNVIYLTADWRVSSYDVYFMNGATGRKIESIKVKAGQTISEFLADAEQNTTGLTAEALVPEAGTGKEFYGWYTDSNYGTEFSFDEDKIKADKTEIWAKVAPETYTVTFDSDGGTPVATQTLEYNDLVDEPADPTREGFEFQGWYNGTSKFIFTARVRANYNLKAKWKAVKVNVTFEGEGLGSTTAFKKRTVDWGTKASEVALRTRITSSSATPH